jgi:hypothetical protein
MRNDACVDNTWHADLISEFGSRLAGCGEEKVLSQADHGE